MRHLLLFQRRGIDCIVVSLKFYLSTQARTDVHIVGSKRPRHLLNHSTTTSISTMISSSNMYQYLCRKLLVRYSNHQSHQSIRMITSNISSRHSWTTRYNSDDSFRPFSTASQKNTIDPKIEDYLSSQSNLIDDVNLDTNAKRNLYVKVIRSLESVYGKGQVKISHLQSFGTAGLKALIASIIQEEAATLKAGLFDNTKQKPVVTVRFQVPHHKTEFDLPWYYTTIQPNNQTSTLLDLKNDSSEGAALLSEYIGASCGGNCSCATCHVYIDTKTDGKSPAQGIELSALSEAEQDMLDLAYQPTDQSRLACQVRLLKLPEDVESRNAPVLHVTIPSGVNGFWN